MEQSLSTKVETTNGGETNREDEEVNTTIAGMKEHVISMGRTLSTKLETTNGGETSRDHEEVNTVIAGMEEHVIPMEQSPSTECEITNAGETSRDNEEKRQEWNEHGADLASNAETYLRSILRDDDQDVNKYDSNKFVHCPKIPLIQRNNPRSKNYYDPQIVSFGPYHHGKEELRATQMIKTKVMRKFIKNETLIEGLYAKVSEILDHIRCCYVAGSTDAYNNEKLAMMMLQDGCFILSMIEFRTFNLQEKASLLTPNMYEIHSMVGDHIGGLGIQYLYQDMILLENQIPFRVLDVLMSEIYEGNKGLAMIKSYLNGIYWGIFQSEKHTREALETDPFHLLGLLETLISKFGVHMKATKTFETKRETGIKDMTHRLQSFSSVLLGLLKTLISEVAAHVETKPETGDNTHYLHSFSSVSDLEAKGINFKPSNSISQKSISIRDVEFKSGFFSGELKLPPLFLSSHSQKLYENLIAFESCNRHFTFSSYISFINSLIANAKDVNALRSKRIILHALNSDEEVFKMLKEIPATNYVDGLNIYQGARQKIELHCKSKRKIWIADIRHKYFSQPWSAIGLLAAVFVLILAFLQTFYTINPRKG